MRWMWTTVALTGGCGFDPTLPATARPTPPTGPVCGDGLIGDGEACDDGINDGTYGGCAPGCAKLGPFCGDGVIQARGAETCDDGNDEDGDGCNTDCKASGRLLWSDERDRAVADLVFPAMAVLPNGAVALVDDLSDDDRIGFAARRLDPTGVVIGDPEVDVTAESFEVDEIVGLPTGDFLVSGQLTADDAGFLWLGLLQADGGLGWQARRTADYAYGAWFARTLGAVSDDRFVAVAGAEGTSPMVMGTFGGALIVQPLVREWIVDVLQRAGDDTFWALSRGPTESTAPPLARLVAYDDGLIEQRRSGDYALDSAFAFAAMPDGGFVIGNRTPTGFEVTRTTPALTEQFTRSYEVAGELRIARDLAADPDGNIIVVGGGRSATADFDEQAIVTKLDPGLQLRFERALPLGATGSPTGWTQVIVDNIGDIYVTGARDGEQSWTVKYAR